MNLKEFIAETLVSIIDGVEAAQKEKGGLSVNPPVAAYETDEKHKHLTSLDNELIQMVDFDVALTTTKGTNTQGGIGLMVAGVGLGAKGQTDITDSCVSRIRFNVPLQLPTKDKTIEHPPGADK